MSESGTRPARYTPIKVQCRFCGISWTGNENGLMRHEAICSALTRPVPVFPIKVVRIESGEDR